jgi:hypothetical protein
MPRPGVATGHMAERVCEVLKACRGGFTCARDVAEFCGYKKPDYARALLNKLAESGLLETRKVKANAVGPHTLEYRVAKAWRDE